MTETLTTNTLEQEQREIISVSEVNHLAREILEETFPLLWVEGEISNLACPSSGHIYFSLKDANAQIRCAMFRSRKRHLGFTPKDGMQVLVRANVSLYEARGDFQLIIEHVEEAGFGQLQRALELLKHKLAQEGLFAATHKKPLPAFPQQIGIITSPTGAAIHDILTVLQRRFPAIPIVIYPTSVQGEQAANQIVNAIKIANQHQECDILLLARGGGSLEDLWPFNEESVARAIFKSKIPLVSGIGHEVDFTIADFVADQRAATPSAAAELISPNQAQWQQDLQGIQARLNTLLQQILKQQRQHLISLQKRLRHPLQLLHERMQRLDHVEQNLKRAITANLQQHTTQITLLKQRLKHNNPQLQLQQSTHQLKQLQQRLQKNVQQTLTLARQNLSTTIHTLDTLSPLATLSRGYAIVIDPASGKNIKNASTVNKGSKIDAKLHQGTLRCVVEEVNT